jgi:hypothetical protein
MEEEEEEKKRRKKAKTFLPLPLIGQAVIPFSYLFMNVCE